MHVHPDRLSLADLELAQGDWLRSQVRAPRADALGMENTITLRPDAIHDAHPDARACARVDLHVEVSLDSEHNFFAGLTENVSEGGLFVATHQLRPIGSRVRVELALPGIEQVLRVKCEVRWVRLYNEASDTSPGMGLMFLDLSEEGARVIRAFVDRRVPLLWM